MYDKHQQKPMRIRMDMKGVVDAERDRKVWEIEKQ
jgi:hypothetical protein